MAEARSEGEEEEDLRADPREPAVRRPPSSSTGRPDRRKPEHRHSHGPLSSLRAVIQRTSSRSAAPVETSRQGDRRRPEITILSAEPLAYTSCFPGATRGFPPPPPPAAQIWGASIPPSVQPPPSYEDVIREKTQEQVLHLSSYSSSPPVSTTTIATQTDVGWSAGVLLGSVRPDRPPRPAQAAAPPAAATACGAARDLLHSPLTYVAPTSTAADVETCSPVLRERPRPRPRSRLSAPPVGSEVKVQTLVKLREDGLATLAARTGSDSANQATRGKYLQELLDAFSSDAWGAPEHRSSQSESEEEEEEVMATPRATGEGAKKPEPRPRARLQGQPSQWLPPAIAPKPKNVPHASRPSGAGSWDEQLLTSKPKPLKPSVAPPHGSSLPGAPVPAPRLPPPKLSPAPSDTPTATKAPPRPMAAPRTSSAQVNQSGSGRPAIPNKPAARRASAPPEPDAVQVKLALALRKGSFQIKADDAGAVSAPSDPPVPVRPSNARLLPLRPPPIKSTPGRPPPPTTSSSTRPISTSETSVSSSPTDSPLAASQTQGQRVVKRGPPLPPRPKPAQHADMEQEVPIDLDDPPPLHLLELDTQPHPHQDSRSKAAESQSLLPSQNKDESEPLISGPLRINLSDHEGEDELTFCQGDVSGLQELISHERGWGQIHGRNGIFPLSFTKELKPLSPPPLVSTGETPKHTLVHVECTSEGAEPEEEWAVALYDFTAQTEEDLSFHKGALIQVMEHVDAEWRRGRLEGREGLYPASFTHTCSGQQAAERGVAKALFDFPAASDDELPLKAGDIITQVTSVDEQWILGAVDGKCGIAPKNLSPV